MRVIWQSGQWPCTFYRHIVWDWARVCVCFPILLQGAQAFCWDKYSWGSSYFKGRKYDGCTRAHSVNGKPWCAIQVLSWLISLMKYSHCHDHHDVIASIDNIQYSMACAGINCWGCTALVRLSARVNNRFVFFITIMSNMTIHLTSIMQHCHMPI